MLRISKNATVSVLHLLALRSRRVVRVSWPDSRLSTTLSVRFVRTRAVERVVASTMASRVAFSPSLRAVRTSKPAPMSNLATPTVKPTLPFELVSNPASRLMSFATSLVSRRVLELSETSSASYCSPNSRLRVMRSHLKISTVCSSSGPRLKELTRRPRQYPHNRQSCRNGRYSAR